MLGANPRKAYRLAGSAILALMGLMWTCPAPAGDAETRARIEKLFREGADLFEMGRLEEARARLREVLALDPTAEEANRLVQEIGEKLMIRWMTEPAMGREPRVIYDLYRLHAGRMKRKPSYIKGLVATATDPLQHPVKRWEAIEKLREVGQFAIPFLVEALGDERDHEVRTLARIVATKMGSSAVLPVIELLKLRGGELGESRARLVRENAALILGDIEPPDERALAPLKRVAEDETESPVVRRYAHRSLQKISGVSPDKLPSAKEYYYRKADRYVREAPGVAAEAAEADGVIWRLVGDKLVDFQVPRFAWNELMAEQACYECMEIAPDYQQIYPLYAEVMASQIAECMELVDISTERPIGRPFSEEEAAEVRARAERLRAATFLINALGPSHVYKALGKCLDDADQDQRSLPKLAACVLTERLVAIDPDGRLLPRPGAVAAKGAKEKERKVTGTEGASLIRALRYPDERVQYAAAIALAKMNPPEPFDGAGEVVATLGRAIGESGPLQVLVVEEDPSIRNEIVGKLRDLDIGVAVAESARDALARATAFPPFDVILVSPKLAAAEGTPWLLEQLAQDQRSRSSPVAIISSYSKKADDEQAFNNYKNVKGVVPVEDSGKDLRDLMERLASFRVFPAMTKTRAEEVSVAAAEALAQINPHLARINGMQPEQCADACIGALENRSDRIRRPCLEALGKFKIAKAHDRVLALATDTRQTLEIRAAAVKALGSISPELALEQLLALCKDEKEFILRQLASEGYGRASAAPEKIRAFAQELRLQLEEKHALLEPKEE